MSRVIVMQGLWWLMVVVGLVASGTFLAAHRPRNWFRGASFNASGWVIIIFALYLRSALIGATTGNIPGFTTKPEIAFSLIMGIAIDILLVWRVVSFLQYRKKARMQQGTTKVTSLQR